MPTTALKKQPIAGEHQKWWYASGGDRRAFGRPEGRVHGPEGLFPESGKNRGLSGLRLGH